MTPHERACSAASLAWHAAHETRLTAAEQDELDHHTRRLAEQTAEPVESIASDVDRTARARTPSRAARLLTGLLFGD